MWVGQRSSFRFSCNIVQKNLNECAAQPTEMVKSYYIYSPKPLKAPQQNKGLFCSMAVHGLYDLHSWSYQNPFSRYLELLSKQIINFSPFIPFPFCPQRIKSLSLLCLLPTCLPVPSRLSSKANSFNCFLFLATPWPKEDLSTNAGSCQMQVLSTLRPPATNQGSNPRPLQWRRRLSATHPPGKSLLTLS